MLYPLCLFQNCRFVQCSIFTNVYVNQVCRNPLKVNVLHIDIVLRVLGLPRCLPRIASTRTFRPFTSASNQLLMTSVRSFCSSGWSFSAPGFATFSNWLKMRILASGLACFALSTAGNYPVFKARKIFQFSVLI